MGEKKCSGFKEPESLKDALEFVDMLHTNAAVTNEIISDIKSKVEGYLGTDKGYLFIGGSQSSFAQVLQLLSELRMMLLKDKGYETYKDCTFENNNECIETYASCLFNNIYDIFGSVYYLYFMCYAESRTYGGGDWNNDGNTEESGNLKTWLANKNTGGRALKLRGGFDDDRVNKQISLYGTSDINSTVSMLINFTHGGLLQFPLQHMLFLGRWSNAKTANALLFLGAFCDKVSNGLLSSFQGDVVSKVKELFNSKDDNGNTSDSIKSKCTSLSASINKLTQKIGAGTIASYSMYSYLLAKEKFINYIEWLDNNLHDLITSLNLMKSDIRNWTKNDLKASTSYGPFAFGFCFKDDKWGGANELNSTLSNDISSLIDQLKKLNSRIQPEEKKVTESAPKEDVGKGASSDSTADGSSENSKGETTTTIQEIAKGNSNPSSNTIATASGVAVGTIGLGTLVTYGAASGHLGKTALAVFNAISSAFS